MVTRKRGGSSRELLIGDSEAYRGYLIKKGFRDREYHISKDGYHLGTVDTIAQAKTTIDLLTE